MGDLQSWLTAQGVGANQSSVAIQVGDGRVIGCLQGMLLCRLG